MNRMPRCLALALTIFSVWILSAASVQCTVTLDAAGGSVGVGSVQIEIQETVGTLPDATRPGYVFIGWYTTRDTGGQRVFATRRIGGDVTFYARWKPAVVIEEEVASASAGWFAVDARTVKDTTLGGAALNGGATEVGLSCSPNGWGERGGGSTASISWKGDAGAGDIALATVDETVTWMPPLTGGKCLLFYSSGAVERSAMFSVVEQQPASPVTVAVQRSPIDGPIDITYSADGLDEADLEGLVVTVTDLESGRTYEAKTVAATLNAPGVISIVWDMNAENLAMLSGNAAFGVAGARFAPSVAYGAPCEVRLPAARVGNAEYTSVQEAIDVAPDGATVTMMMDVISSAGLVIGGKSLTIDGRGHQVRGSSADGIVTVKASEKRSVCSFVDVKVVNETTGNNSGAFFCSGPCDIALSNVTVSARNAFCALANAEVSVACDGEDTVVTSGYSLVRNVDTGVVSLSLAGGVYSKDPAIYVASRHGYRNNGNSTWTVFAYPEEPETYAEQTEAGYYIIRSLEQFVAFRAKIRSGQTCGGFAFDLGSDLDLAGVELGSGGTFSGVFDGCGHTISNLVLNQSTTDDVGLFSILRNAKIKNLSIRGGMVEGRNRVGGIAGRINGWTAIEDCTTELEVIANGYEVGGLVGYLDGTGNNRFMRCRTLGPVTAYAAEDRVGGLFGKSDGSFTVDACYASGAITGYGTTGYVGGLLGCRGGGTATFTNSYSVSRLQGNYLTQGGSADDDIVGSGTSGVTVQSRPTVIDCFPKNIVNLAKRGNGSGTVSWSGSTPVATPDPGSVFIRWDNEIPEGDFNEITLYAVFGKAVATEQDLRGLPAQGFFKQTADITMTTNITFEGLHNSPRFQGEYDGAGFEIRGLTINLNADNAGLFRMTQGAVVRGVHLVGGSVKGKTAVGPLVGYQFAGLVEDCLAETDIQATGNHGGGLVGRIESYATVRRSAATGSVTVGGSYAGGLVSYMAGGTSRIEDSYARGDVKAANYCGGFIGGGADQFAIRDCYSAGVVTCSSTAGGFFARIDPGRSVTGCYWDSTKAGQTRSTYGTELSTADMKTAANFSSWDANVWKLVDGEYPELFAVIDSAERFTVTWENADGTTLAVQEGVRAGRVPQYQGALPVKSTEGAKYFCFDGWSPKPTALTSNVTYRATFHEPTVRTWMTVDLATGEIGYADYDVPTATALFNTLEFKTTKMAFRRVASGLDYYVQNGAYTAQMTNSYYIGVFEVTVAQFAMMQNGTKPASYVLADLKAQGSRNRSNTRGGTTPAAFGAGITAGSPLGLFNARVRTANGDERLTFDLPTEAMWEVAARAAASGDLVRRTWNWYFGEDESLLADHAFLANDTSPDDWGSTSGIRVPGSRLPNGWGLYDIYGNVRELCLDGATGEATPDYVQGNWTEAPGYVNGSQRTRGGGYDDESSRGRSSWRTYHDSGAYGHTGIRLARICAEDEEFRPIHTVVWKNFDGTVLATDRVPDGLRASYNGPTPTKPSDDAGFYFFAGWSPEINVAVKDDVVYTAVFELAVQMFTCDDAQWPLENDGSWRSAAIGNRETTAVRMEVVGPGTLTFEWKVSSEGSYDWLNFYRGDTRIDRISGSRDWAKVTCRVDDAGAVIFRWTYSKDSSSSGGQDCGWLKNIAWMPDGVFVPTSATGSQGLTIPLDWFDRYPSFAEKFGTDRQAAALMPTGKTAADGSPMYVWQDFVNGCDPTNPEEVFRATIEMVDGVPYVSWEPNLNTNETLRIYRILGKADLADPGEEWLRVRPGHRFFKVTVEMPNGSAVSDVPGLVDVGGDWESNLLCHLSFDDYGNDGLNVLKVQGGVDAVVRTTPANVVTGLGMITVVTDSSILAGLEPGDGAVKIPQNTHIALPIPAALLDREGHPYTLKMKMKFPNFGRYYTILNMPGTNDSDGMVFLTNSGAPVIALKIMNKRLGQSDGGSGGFAVNTWEELTFQFGETNTRILLNGSEIYSGDLKLADSYADCYDAGGCFVISGDDNGEDNEMYWADVKVYDGIVD